MLCFKTIMLKHLNRLSLHNFCGCASYFSQNVCIIHLHCSFSALEFPQTRQQGWQLRYVLIMNKFCLFERYTF